MAEKDQKRVRRVSPWLLGAIVLVLMTFLVLLQSSNLWKKLSVESANDTLLLYALSSLNFFAFVIFGFIFLRSLLKLSRERRAFVLGSKFKTRLWLYFFLISVLPIIAMAGFSYLFMNRALERWFTQIPEDVVRRSQEIKNKAISLQAEKFRETAEMLAVTLDEHQIGNGELARVAEAGGLSHVEVLSRDGKTVESATRESAQNEEFRATIAMARSGGLDDPKLSDGKGFDAAVATLRDGRRLLVVSSLFAEESASQFVDQSLIEFDRLKGEQTTVRQIGLSTLGLLTFLLIFASSWMAVYIARGLTVPLNALAEGADEIARGKLGHQVDVFAEDELALLVRSFNQMSAKLGENSAELEERRRYTETVLLSLSTGVISFDAGNRVTTINSAAIQILRLEDADFTGFRLEQLFKEENRVVIERLLGRARRVGQASEQTVLQRENVAGGTDSVGSLPVAISATALPQGLAEASGIVLVIEDLSELIAAQRASAWAEVARRMAHEIKNPLTPIQLSAERIAKRCALGGNPEQAAGVVKDGTETILREVNSLKALVDEFSRFARLPNVKLESGSVNETIAQAAALYEDRGVALEQNLAADLPEAMIDDEQLKRVFVNLIENAIEAFDPTQADKRISLKSFLDSGRDLIVAEVSDNGAGISPADFQKLFQPYFSTKGRGTGLGLAIVQRIVSEHRGKIKAVNNSGGGAKFIVELPTGSEK
ncbi:MAG: HAMP domain-containing protein [Acidobacteria bacterium]|nr:HAMP domain-containing protein [Acidobacteriota bacterium]